MYVESFYECVVSKDFSFFEIHDLSKTFRKSRKALHIAVQFMWLIINRRQTARLVVLQQLVGSSLCPSCATDEIKLL